MNGEITYIKNYAPETLNLKICVCVKAYFNKEGIIIPETVLWDDGRQFKIDRITDRRPASSLKSGGTGIRYTCMIGNNQTYLYLDGNKWFVDRKRR